MDNKFYNLTEKMFLLLHRHTSARMSMDVRGEQEDNNLARYSNLIRYRLYAINWNFYDDYWGTAVV